MPDVPGALLELLAGARPRTLELPAGTFTLPTLLTVPENVTLHGQGRATILQPAAGVVLANGARLEALDLDGTGTDGVTGLSIGVDALVGHAGVRDVQVQHFAGVGAIGLRLAQGVTVRCDNVYLCRNAINLVTGGPSTPTNSIFLNCQFREATTKGAWIQDAYSLLFLSCLFESNGEEGLYLANAGGNAIDVRLWDCWFENNWNRLPLGADRHARYECVVDGLGAGTIRPELRSCLFTGGPTSARSIHFSGAIDFLLDHVKVTNAPGDIRLDSNSYGTVVNWPAQNGAYAVTVDDTQGATRNTEARLTALLEGSFATWSPTVTPAGAMTLATVSVSRARWLRVGPLVQVSLVVTFVVGGVPAATVSVSLPDGLTVPADDDTYLDCDGNEPATGVWARQYARVVGGAAPALQVGRKDNAAWPLGLGEIVVNAAFEVL